MAPSDLAERLAFLFPTTFVADGQPAAPDPDDHLELRRLVTLDLALPAAANDLEARALSTFVDLRAYFARLVLADLGGAWQTVVRLLDDGRERDEVLGEINGVLTDHVLEPLASGSDVDVAEVHRALDRLGRSSGSPTPSSSRPGATSPSSAPSWIGSGSVTSSPRPRPPRSASRSGSTWPSRWTAPVTSACPAVRIGGSFVLPSSTSVGWVVPVGGTPTFLFGAMVEADVATAADAFTGASEVDAIADALGRLWRRERTTTS